MPDVINNIFAWLDRRKATKLDKINGYITLPAFNLDLTTLIPAGFDGSYVEEINDFLPLVVQKINYTSPADFVLSHIPKAPSEVNFVLAVSFTEQTGRANIIPPKVLSMAGGPAANQYEMGMKNVGEVLYNGIEGAVYGIDWEVNKVYGYVVIYASRSGSDGSIVGKDTGDVSYWQFTGGTFSISYTPVETRQWTTKRYALWNKNEYGLSGLNITFGVYNGELIRKNFALEVWAIDTKNKSAWLYNPIDFKTSIKKTKVDVLSPDVFYIASPVIVPFTDLLNDSIVDGDFDFTMPVTFKDSTVQNNIL